MGIQKQYLPVVVVSGLLSALLAVNTCFASDDTLKVKPFYEKPNDDAIQNTLNQMPNQQGYYGGYNNNVPSAVNLANPLPKSFIVALNTKFSGTLMNPLSSEDANEGDQFNIVLVRDIHSQSGNTILPKGTIVKGKVVDVQSSGYPRRKAKMKLHFFEAKTPTGRKFIVDAEVNSRGGKLRGNVKTKSKSSRGASLVSSALSMGAGMATGPIGGLGVRAGMIVLGKKGKEIALNAGDPIDIRLNQPITRQSVSYDPAPQFNQNPVVAGMNLQAKPVNNIKPAVHNLAVQPKPAYELNMLKENNKAYIPVQFDGSVQGIENSIQPVTYGPQTTVPVQTKHRIDIE